jgi:DNA-binding protein H-NS
MVHPDRAAPFSQMRLPPDQNGDLSRSVMVKLRLKNMDLDELWRLHEELTKILAEKITGEKLELENRLAQLRRTEHLGKVARPEAKADRPRRKYPKVLPKYSNPSVPTETWSGRGKQPRWLVAALRSGHKLEDFLIAKTEKAAGHKVRRGQHS